jgi:hypothetical protein
MRGTLACLSALFVSACSTDSIRQIENNEDITGPALAAQKQALDGGCLSYVFEGKPLRELMAGMPDAQSIPAKETRSPTAVEAWKVGSRNAVYVMQLPEGRACSVSVLMGDPQRLYDAAVTLMQSRSAFTRGKVDASERGDAERSAWCTAGLYPYVVVLYRRTTGTRDAFLANVFKAQGATFSACRPNS